MPIGLKGNSDGSGAIQIGGSDAISISTGLNTTFAGTITATGTVAGTTGTLYPLVSGTAVASTSGTAIDFTGIPSWVRRITVMFGGVSTNGASPVQIQIGSGSIDTSGYTGAAANLDSGVAIGAGNNSTGFRLANGWAATLVCQGAATICLLSGNTWVFSSTLGRSDIGSMIIGGGAKTLSGALDRIRITTGTGADTFDAGTINLLWE